MPISDETTRRQIEAEFRRGFSPLEVGMEWNHGDFRYQVEGLEPAAIPRASLAWNSAMESIKTVRGGLLRNGVKLDPWELPPPPTLS
jgi:hypothetical protein